MKGILYTLALALLFTGSGMAQNRNTARKLFNEGKYAEAKPMFRKLLKKSPKDSEYSYWYAVCCYETGDSVDIIPLLEFAASRKISNAFRYLGDIFAAGRDYPSAVAKYESFLELTKDDSLRQAYRKKLADVTRLKRMIMNCEKVCIVDSTVVDKNDFLSAYKIGYEAGTLMTQAEFFDDSSLDGCLYCSERGMDIYFADVENEGDSLRKLYSNSKVADEWGRAARIKGFDTKGNDDYPFMLSDGVTLYFASDGEGSIGGYDLFVTRLNSENGTFLRPDNLGMPFNSAANDYMLAINEIANLGWFASDRNQPEGKVCIYMFVPNEDKERYDESLDYTTLLSRASISSIADTQDDEELMRKALQQYALLQYNNSKNPGRRDFLFVIDDSHDYTRLPDFKSEAACEMFTEWRDRKADLEEDIELLEMKRDEYASASEKNREVMRGIILELERRVENEEESLLFIEREIRRIEQEELYK